MSEVYVGVDLGTSSVKVVAVDGRGVVLAASRQPYPTARPEPGAAEQHTGDWWVATRAGLSAVGARVPPASWAGVGLSGMLPTLVELGDDLAAVGPAVTWEDGRAEPEADRFRDRVGGAAIYAVTGQRLDGRYLAPMHGRRVADGSAGSIVAGAKDWLFLQLTGELLTDPSTAAGYGTYDLAAGRWHSGLMAASGLTAVPRVEPSTTIVPMGAGVSDDVGCAPGTPVVLGAADSVLGAFGMGAGPDDVAVISGTSTIVLGGSDRVVLDAEQRYLVTPMATGGFGFEMDLLSTGSAVAWLADLLHFDGPDALVAAATAVDPRCAPDFLPFLAPGEQGALWDPGLTGLLSGLRLDTTREQVARGLITGIVRELTRCIAVLGETTGSTGIIRLAGQGAFMALLQRDLADATGRIVLRSTIADQSAVGAAALAARAVGDAALPNAVLDSTASSNTAVEPRAGAADLWVELAARHDALVSADVGMRRGVPR